MTDLTLRPSEFKIARLCPASIQLESPLSRVAVLGDAFHKAIIYKIKGESIDWKKIGIEFGITDNEEKDLRINVSKIDIKIPKDCEVFIEKKLSGLDGKIEGTPDLVIIKGKRAWVIDWKSGYGEVDEAGINYQLRLYVLLVWLFKKDIEEITAQIMQPKLDEVSETTYSSDDINLIAEYVEDVHAFVLENKDSFIFGDHCKECFKSSNCPKFKQQFQNLVLYGDAELTDIEKIKRALVMMKGAERILDLIKMHAQEYVKIHGDIDLGSEIYTQEEIVKDSMDSVQAYEFLKDAPNIGKAVTISKSSIFKAFKDAKSIIEYLKQKGAIKKKPYHRFVFKKKKVKE